MALFPCFPEEKEKFLKSIKCQAGQTGGMKEEAMESKAVQLGKGFIDEYADVFAELAK